MHEVIESRPEMAAPASPRAGSGKPARRPRRDARPASVQMRNAMAIVLAGGRGTRLAQLTDWRAKPAVAFGGTYRIVDFVLSNCVNSGLRRIGICTQYKAQSLIGHVQRGWSFLDGRFGEFIELWPAQQRVEPVWYRGTADAVYQNIDLLIRRGPLYVFVLAGDHVYKMDYQPMLAEHVDSGADVTVACMEVPVGDARSFGVVQADADGWITRFDEKPEHPQTLPGRPDTAFASMGNYVFKADLLYSTLIDDATDRASDHDFGRNLIPGLIRAGARVRAHNFRDSCVNMANGLPYWRDVGTIDAFWEANLDLTRIVPDLNLYDQDWPIWGHPHQLPPAKFVFDEDRRRGVAPDSLVAGGCIVSGALVRRSLLSINTRIEERAAVEESVILPEVHIGAGAIIRRAVVDKYCRIPAGLVIGADPASDRARFNVTDRGVTLITPDMLGQHLPAHQL